MTSHRFQALDGLRGVCALLVLVYHLFHHAGFNPLPHGYLSVDIFFALSGFVLAYAFGDRLEAGMAAADFLRARIMRLGPVVGFAAAFSVLGCLVSAALGAPAVPFAALMLAGLRSLFLLPMTGAASIDAFPLNGPIWSLFAEFWVNVGFVLIAPRLKLSTLAAIIAAGWAFVIMHALRAGTGDFGAAQSQILYSVPRAIPSFATGVLIFRLWRTGVLARLPSLHPLLVCAAWIAVSAAPIAGPAFDLVQIVLVVPLVIALLARSTQGVPGWALWLGRISYPLYATHCVIIYAGQRLTHGALPIWTAAVLAATAILLADMLARWYEPAFRRRPSRIAAPIAQNAAA